MQINSNYTAASSPSLGVDPQELLFLQQELQNLYNAFTKDPSEQNAQNLLHFLQENQANLKVLATEFTNYQPLPGINYDQLFKGLIVGLQNYNPNNPSPALFEFLNDFRIWTGVDENPQDVENTVVGLMQNMIEYMQKFGTLDLSALQSLLCMFNASGGYGEQGFFRALEVFAKDKGAFAKDFDAVDQAVLAYQQNPSAANLTQVENSLQAMINELN